MSGEYCKLIYILKYEYKAIEDDSYEIQKAINKLLKDVQAPFDVKQQIKRLYKAIFNRELERTSDIKAEYLVHWH